MPTVRYDSVPIKPLYLDPNTGFLHANDVPIARVGVFPYIRKDGAVSMEAKLPEDLLSQETVSSANSKPITDNHPSEMVNRNNATELMKGLTANNAHVDGDKLKVDMTITDPALIKEVQNGKQELSIGFSTDVSPTKGSFEGTKYDCAQKNIQINHVAVVERGRAGHSVRLTGDSAEMVIDSANDESEDTNSMETTTIRLDGANVTVASQDADRIMKLDADNEDKSKQIAEYQAQIKELQEKIKALQGDADSSKEDADKAKADADRQKAKTDALEKELAGYRAKEEKAKLDDVIAIAKPYVGDSYDFDGKTAKDIKADTLKADGIDLEGKSDDYIDAYFDSLAKHNESNSGVVGYNGPENKTDSVGLEAELAKNKYDLYHLAD